MTEFYPRRDTRLMMIPIVFLLLALTACNRAVGGSDGAAVPLYTDILTLEASIEDDPTMDDFQIVSPRDIGVDADGNIYLADEYSLKIYTPDGSPFRLIGREGTGPGEFAAPFSTQVGPTGHIAAMDVLWDVNVYAPDGEFLDRIGYRSEDPWRSYLRERGYTFTMMQEVVALDADRLLIDLFTLNQTLPDLFVGTLDLLCATADSLTVLCRYQNYESVRIAENSNTSVEFQGDLLWSLLDADHLLYTHTRVDRVEAGNDSRYHLITLDMRDMSTDTLAVPWFPEVIPPAIKVMRPHYSEFLDRTFEVDPVVQEVMDDTDIYPPLKALRSDQGIAFGFHFAPTDSVERDFEDDDLAVEPHLVDIIDLATGRLTARAEFPFLPEVIRDGFAYRLFTPEDDFPAVRVYRIDPRLYALREGMD